MKVVHFADTHLREHGKFEPEHHLHGRTLDYLDSMDYMIDAIIEEDVNLVVFAGDAFHSHNPNQNILYLFAEKIADIAHHCPIVMVPGNHDMPGPAYKASAIDIFGLEIPGVTVANQCKIYEIETTKGIIQVGAFPYPMRQHILSENLLKRSKQDTWVKYKGEVSKLLTELPGSLKTGVPSILVGHFTVSGAFFTAKPSMLLDDEVEVELMDLVENTGWDYIALGHLHNHQVVFDDPPVVYSGSLDRLTFLDEKDVKGFMMIEFENGKLKSHDFITNTMARHMLTIDINVNGIAKPMPEVMKIIEESEVDDKIVRVRISADSDLYIDKNEINTMLEAMGMYELHSISVKVPYEHHSRLDGEKSASAYTEEEMLEIFFDELDDDEYDKVMDLADDIMGDVRNE